MDLMVVIFFHSVFGNGLVYLFVLLNSGSFRYLSCSLGGGGVYFFLGDS